MKTGNNFSNDQDSKTHYLTYQVTIPDEYREKTNKLKRNSIQKAFVRILAEQFSIGCLNGDFSASIYEKIADFDYLQIRDWEIKHHKDIIYLEIYDAEVIEHSSQEEKDESNLISNYHQKLLVNNIRESSSIFINIPQLERFKDINIASKAENSNNSINSEDSMQKICTPIQNLNHNLRDWIIRGRVIYKLPKKVKFNYENPHETYFKISIIDIYYDEIDLLFYGNQSAKEYFNKIVTGKIYVFSGGELSKNKFDGNKNIIFNNFSRIYIDLQKEDPNMPVFSSRIKKILDIKACQNGDLVDTFGIIKWIDKHPTTVFVKSIYMNVKKMIISDEKDNLIQVLISDEYLINEAKVNELVYLTNIQVFQSQSGIRFCSTGKISSYEFQIPKAVISEKFLKWRSNIKTDLSIDDNSTHLTIDSLFSGHQTKAFYFKGYINFKQTNVDLIKLISSEKMAYIPKQLFLEINLIDDTGFIDCLICYSDLILITRDLVNKADIFSSEFRFLGYPCMFLNDGKKLFEIVSIWPISFQKESIKIINQIELLNF